VEFELDAGNLKHFREDHPERGITRELLNEVVGLRSRLQDNEPNASRSATHKVVGPDANGRFWTFPAVLVVGNKWRPITGWPSTRVEIELYNEGIDA